MKNFQYSLVRFSVIIACFAAASISTADAPPEGTKPAQWRVTWTSDPATSAIVSWSTAQQGSSHTLEYQIKGDESSKGVGLAESGRYTGGSDELYYHHVRLSDLQPSTAYEIQMKSDGDVSPTFYFLTAPSEDRAFSILHGGDSRSDQKARRKVNAAMAQMVADSFDNEDPADDIIAFAHGGDYVASGPRMDQWSEWLSDHELTTCNDGRLLPIIPTRGNHDKGKPFNEIFAFPEGDLNYYAINLGPECRFITLNTETSTAGDQARWLGEELAKSRRKLRWVLAQYHRPAFPAVKSPSTALQSWVPLFEKYYVDLVCESDGHNIKRTVPIRGNVQDESGVVYIGEGGLGVPQRTPKPERWYLQAPGMTDRGDHVFMLTFGQELITGKCILVDGTVRDEFTRPARGGR